MMNTLIKPPCHIKFLGIREYSAIFQSMKEFTDTRTQNSHDQIWIVEHLPVYTTGGKNTQPFKENTLNSVPVVPNNRGGSITYHGPGQWIFYLLLNLRHQSLNASKLVDQTEKLLISLLEKSNISSQANPSARGIYVQDKKIASIGYRISRGFCYHGFALNVNMDLSPFDHIDPCGIKGQTMTQVLLENPSINTEKLKEDALQLLIQFFCSNHQSIDIHYEHQTTQ